MKCKVRFGIFENRKFFSGGYFCTKCMSIERPFNVLQEFVLEDGIRLLDWLSDSIFENKLKIVFVLAANQVSGFRRWAPIFDGH